VGWGGEEGRGSEGGGRRGRGAGFREWGVGERRLGIGERGKWWECSEGIVGRSEGEAWRGVGVEGGEGGADGWRGDCGGEGGGSESWSSRMGVRGGVWGIVEVWFVGGWGVVWCEVVVGGRVAGEL